MRRMKRRMKQAHMSIIFGLEKMPYCWSAKSYAKESGAITRAVECVTPMLMGFAVVNAPKIPLQLWRKSRGL
jgi:hypothetical protein